MGSKSERTRERILDAAASVLSDTGYAGMRLGDVAQVAGLRTPAIYYHFASKDELVEEVMWVGAHRVRVHVEGAVAALPARVSGLERILAAVEAHLRYELQVSAYASASIRNARQVPEALRERPAAEESRYSHLWRDLFATAAKDGEIRDDLDLSTFRMLLLGALNWVVEWWRPGTRSLDDLIEVAQDMVRRSIAP
jgi:AcrR family transcriptional regulator